MNAHKFSCPKWLDRSQYPFVHRFRTTTGHKQHYIDEGTGPILLFVHGTPSWSFDFRKVIVSLSSRFRCIAIDHIGFGLSDKPDNYDYSIESHIRNLETFITENDLREVTLIVHDFGGPIGFGAANRFPERISRVVVLNSWLFSAEGDPEFEKMKRILRSPLLPFLYLRLNVSPRFLLPGSMQQKPSKAIKAHFIKPFGKASERKGALAFARSLLNDQPLFEELWKQRSLLSQKPVLLIWGMKDPVVKPHLLVKWKEGFPSAGIVKLNDSGHFPQEEQPVEVADAIRVFCS